MERPPRSPAPLFPRLHPLRSWGYYLLSGWVCRLGPTGRGDSVLPGRVSGDLGLRPQTGEDNSSLSRSLFRTESVRDDSLEPVQCT